MIKLRALSNKRGITVIEVLSCIAVILILASLLLGSLYSVREKGKTVLCLNNLKNLTASFILFANDQNQFPTEIAGSSLPQGEDSEGLSFAWAGLSDYYDHQMGITKCPKVQGTMVNTPPVYSYGINQLIRGVNLHVVEDSSLIIVVGESENRSVLGIVEEVGFRHFHRALFGFSDGHVQPVRVSELEDALLDYFGTTTSEGASGYGVLYSPISMEPPPEADIPFTFTDGSVCSNGFRWDFEGLTDNGDGTSTFTFTLTNSNDHGLIYTAFELPEGVTAVSPPDGGTYYGTNSSYHVQNTANEPFHSIKFHTVAVGQGIQEGQSETFSFTMNTSDAEGVTSMRVQGKAARTIGGGTFEQGPPGTGNGGCGG